MDIALTYVVPAHNSSDVIEDTVEQLAKRLQDTLAEIIVVENGSTDETPAILERIAGGWRAHQPSFKVLASGKGLGNAYRSGIAASHGKVVVLTADDLPFGFDDLDGALDHDVTKAKVLIGSKAHPRSDIARSPMRSVLSFGYRALLRVLLGLRTGDPQGTHVLDGPWARAIEPSLVEQGYLVSTEIAWAAELSRVRPVELPVRLRETRHTTRVNPVADSWQMGKGLWRMRRRRAVLKAAALKAAALRED